MFRFIRMLSLDNYRPEGLVLRQTHYVAAGRVLQANARRPLGQRLDVLKLALDLPGARLSELDRVGHRLQLALGAREHLAELAELSLHAAEHLPDFGRAFLDRQRAESHLQAVEQRRQRGRTADGDAQVALQL